MPAKIKNRSDRVSHRHTRAPRGVTRQAFEKVYWPYIPLLLLCAFLAALGIRSGALSNNFKHANGEVLAYSTSMRTRSLLTDTNSARLKNREPALNLNKRLNLAAQAKAKDMAARDYWSHTTPDGRQPWSFFTAKGYQYQKAGENLAAGFDNEQSVINAWLASPAHRHNLLDPAYQDVGFGVANIADYKAAGGGEMTVVVAFYGEAAGTIDTPISPSSIHSDSFTSSNINPETSANLRTSRAEVGFADLKLYNFATYISLIIMVGAIGLWASRHALLLHKVLIKGERFVIKHPLLDVGLLVLAALAFLLTQTAGLIK